MDSKAAAEEKQTRAERLRVALVEERLARLAKAKESREQVAAKAAKVGWIGARRVLRC